MFGFTGTPIFEQNSIYQQVEGQQASYKTTQDLFQRQLHAYTITHAIEDRNVLRFHIDYFKPEGVHQPRPGEPLTKRAIIDAILDKHDAATAGRKFNAALATASINDAIAYHDLFVEVQAAREAADGAFQPLNIACVFSPPAEGNKDVQQIQEDLPQERADNQVEPDQKKAALQAIIADYNARYNTNHSLAEFDLYYQDVQKRIKDQQYPNRDLPHSQKIDLVIVVDMLLTGFDSTYLNTLYVDKNLKYHGLIQACSRTNRVLNDTKPYGNILDFRQQQDAVNDAIALFSGEQMDRAKEIWLVDPAPVLIEDGRIVAVGTYRQNTPRGDAMLIDAVGAHSQITPRGDAMLIDANGGWILPGLIDTHVHVMMEGLDIPKMLTTPFSYNFYKAIDHMRRTLEAGITTVRDAGGADLGIKQAQAEGLIAGPRLQISVTALSITGGHGDGWMPSGMVLDLFPPYPGMPDNKCDGVEEVRRKVREVLRAGADVIKVCSTGGVLSPTDHPEYTQFTEEELRVMVQEGAYRRGVKVMAHAQGAEGIKNAVRAGIHSIEHGIYLDDEAIELMWTHGTFLVPTLLAPLSVLEQAKAKGNMPEYGVRKARESIEAHRESIAAAYKAGVTIAMGTDAGVMPHGTNLRELGLMVAIGMSPMEAIVATTKTAAECLGWQDRLGTLEAGKLADVIISRSDPLADIRSLEQPANIVLVMQEGKIVKRLGD